jgi:hypothetical protein
LPRRFSLHIFGGLSDGTLAVYSTVFGNRTRYFHEIWWLSAQVPGPCSYQMQWQSLVPLVRYS